MAKASKIDYSRLFWPALSLIATLISSGVLVGLIGAGMLSISFSWPFILLASVSIFGLGTTCLLLGFGLEQFKKVRKALHYLTSIVSSAATAAYLTSSSLKVILGIGVGLSIVAPPVGLGILVCTAIAILPSMILSFIERRRKYQEHEEVKARAEDFKMFKKLKEAEIKRLKRSLTQDQQEKLSEFEKQLEALRNTEFSSNAKNSTTHVDDRSKSQILERDAAIHVTEPEENKNPTRLGDIARKFFRPIIHKIFRLEFAFSALARQTRSIIPNLNIGYKLVLTVGLVGLGIVTLNPLLVAAGAACGIVLGIAGYFRDRWETDVYDKSNKLRQELKKDMLDYCLLCIEEQFIDELSSQSQTSATTDNTVTETTPLNPQQSVKVSSWKTQAEHKKNQANNSHASRIKQYLANTFSSSHTFVFGLLAMTSLVVGVALAPATAGTSFYLSLASCALFTVLAGGNLIYRMVNETKQQKRLARGLNNFKELEPYVYSLKPKYILELTAVGIHPAIVDAQSSLSYKPNPGDTNRHLYKFTASTNKTLKSLDYLATPLAVVGIGTAFSVTLGAITLNPVLLVAGAVISMALGALTYKAEQHRIKRDRKLRQLEATVDQMRLAKSCQELTQVKQKLLADHIKSQAIKQSAPPATLPSKPQQTPSAEAQPTTIAEPPAPARAGKSVAIIGKGFSGIVTLANMVRLHYGNQPLHITLFEKTSDTGGIAYGKRAQDEHVMNVPISHVSAFVGQDTHLLDWLNSATTDKSNWPEPWQKLHWQASDFCPRKIYGYYLAHILNTAHQEKESKQITISEKEAEVTDIALTDDHTKIELQINSSTNNPLSFDHVILATGNERPFKQPNFTNAIQNSKGKYFPHLWETNAMEEIKAIELKEDIVVIGTGLSAMDVVLSRYQKLKDQIEQAKATPSSVKLGKIYLVSRHGLLHTPYTQSGTKWVAKPTVSTSALTERNDIRLEIVLQQLKLFSHLYQSAEAEDSPYRFYLNSYQDFRALLGLFDEYRKKANVEKIIVDNVFTSFISAALNKDAIKILFSSLKYLLITLKSHDSSFIDYNNLFNELLVTATISGCIKRKHLETLVTGMPFSTGQILAELMEHDLIEVHSVNIKQISNTPAGFEIRGRSTPDFSFNLTCHYIINATGFDDDYHKPHTLLYQNLFARRIARPHPEKFGLVVNKTGQLPHYPQISCVGPMRAAANLGHKFSAISTEISIIALRPQSQNVAKHVLTVLGYPLLQATINDKALAIVTPRSQSQIFDLSEELTKDWHQFQVMAGSFLRFTQNINFNKNTTLLSDYLNIRGCKQIEAQHFMVFSHYLGIHNSEIAKAQQGREILPAELQAIFNVRERGLIESSKLEIKDLTLRGNEFIASKSTAKITNLLLENKSLTLLHRSTTTIQTLDLSQSRQDSTCTILVKDNSELTIKRVETPPCIIWPPQDLTTSTIIDTSKLEEIEKWLLPSPERKDNQLINIVLSTTDTNQLPLLENIIGKIAKAKAHSRIIRLDACEGLEKQVREYINAGNFELAGSTFIDLLSALYQKLAHEYYARVLFVLEHVSNYDQVEPFIRNNREVQIQLLITTESLPNKWTGQGLIKIRETNTSTQAKHTTNEIHYSPKISFFSPALSPEEEEAQQFANSCLQMWQTPAIS